MNSIASIFEEMIFWTLWLNFSKYEELLPSLFHNTVLGEIDEWIVSSDYRIEPYAVHDIWPISRDLDNGVVGLSMYTPDLYYLPCLTCTPSLSLMKVHPFGHSYKPFIRDLLYPWYNSNIAARTPIGVCQTIYNVFFFSRQPATKGVVLIIIQRNVLFFLFISPLCNDILALFL